MKNYLSNAIAVALGFLIMYLLAGFVAWKFTFAWYEFRLAIAAALFIALVISFIEDSF